MAPYVLPVLLPVLHCTHPDLCLDLLNLSEFYSAGVNHGWTSRHFG
jgi:hypothetical protein